MVWKIIVGYLFVVIGNFNESEFDLGVRLFNFYIGDICIICGLS